MKKSTVIGMVILGLLILSPLDALPDFLPFIGLLDDLLYGLGIIAGVMKMISGKRANEEPEVVIDAQQWDNH